MDGRRSSETLDYKGDDGKRVPGELVYNEVEDPKGSFELLLFCLIYNLRVKANKVGSEVLFNIGNHEWMTVIDPPEYSSRSSAYNQYVTTTAQKFFKNILIRQEALGPFLNTSPYCMLGFYNGTKREMASVHGGLHSVSENHTDALEKFQEQIDSGT